MKLKKIHLFFIILLSFSLLPFFKYFLGYTIESMTTQTRKINDSTFTKTSDENNDTLYKMDWFDNDNFDNMIARSRNRSRKSSPVKKSSSPREQSPLKEIVAAVNLEELSPKTRKMRKDLEDQRKQAARDRPVSPTVTITNPNPLRLNMSRSVRYPSIDASVDIEDTTRFPIGRSMHECSRLVDNCKSITQLKNRGAYSIVYNDGTENVFGTFNSLVKFITDDYMIKNRKRIPHHQRPMHEARVINTLTENGITARCIKTRKNNKKRKGTRRKGTRRKGKK